MKFALTILVMLLVSACSGPEVPKAYLPDSPASPEAPPASRLSVAAVLAAPNPSDARVCAPDQPCALVEVEGAASPGGHDHGNHAGHGAMNHDKAGHDHANHGGKLPAPAPATNHAGHDHSGHTQGAQPPAAPPKGHEHHSGHNH